MKKMVFCNIAWMNEYRGATKKDMPVHGGSNVSEGWASEAYNFQPYKGTAYGFVYPSGEINLVNLGASPKDDSIDGILVIWVATAPEGGRRIVGWYKNATVYREYRKRPPGSARVQKASNGESYICDYNITAKAKDAFLLSLEKRNFPVPSHEKNAFGNCNVWYGDGKKREGFREDVINYVNHDGVPKRLINKPRTDKNGKNNTGAAWQQGFEKRKAVESAAIKETWNWLKDNGYKVKDVQKDCCGWDLEANLKGERLPLLIEVKGTSGGAPVAELTVNEYSQLIKKGNIGRYRICIVTHADTKKRHLRIFRYNISNDKWVDQEDGRVLVFTERTTATIEMV